ncbi:MAG: DUF1858 domain-containing protein [Clostridia bacterium]|nr:DUF1858 domain-containing protein [Clostridia bacterium]
MEITKDLIIAKVLEAKQGAAQVFMRHGSHCLTCGKTTYKTVADMAEKHEVNLEELLEELNGLPDA